MTGPTRPADERLEELARRLDIDLEGGPPPGEALLVWQFVPMDAGLPGWRPERVRRLPVEDSPPMTRSAWRPAEAADEDVLLMLDIVECADATDARAWLLRVLAGVQSTAIERLARGAPGELAIGMPGGGMLAFVRANLVCVLRNGGRTVRSVGDTAGALDGWVTARPEPGGRVPPEIRRAEAGAAEPDGLVPIHLDAAEPVERPVWFKLVAPAGQLALGEEGPRYRPERAGGPATIRIYAVGPGGVAMTSIDIGGEPGR